MIRNTKIRVNSMLFFGKDHQQHLDLEVSAVLDDMSVLHIVNQDGVVVQTIDLHDIIEKRADNEYIEANVCMCPVDVLMRSGCKCKGV